MTTLWPAALTAMTLALAAPALARAEAFVLITYERPADFAARTDAANSTQYWARWNAVAAAMAQSGVLRGGSALTTDVERLGAGQAAASPSMSGFFSLEVIDREAALTWARKLQTAGAAAVEVRSLQANPSMH